MLIIGVQTFHGLEGVILFPFYSGNFCYCSLQVSSYKLIIILKSPSRKQYICRNVKLPFAFWIKLKLFPCLQGDHSSKQQDGCQCIFTKPTGGVNTLFDIMKGRFLELCIGTQGSKGWLTDYTRNWQTDWWPLWQKGQRWSRWMECYGEPAHRSRKKNVCCFTLNGNDSWNTAKMNGDIVTIKQLMLWVWQVGIKWITDHMWQPPSPLPEFAHL